MVHLGRPSSVIQIALALNERLLIDLGVCYLFVGLGLLKRKPSSHNWAMFWTNWELVMIPIVSILILLFAEPCRHRYEFFGVGIGFITTPRILVLLTLMMCFTYWQYMVLDSREVRLLFSKENTWIEGNLNEIAIANPRYPSI